MKNLLLSFCLLLLAQNIQSQNWCSHGATWYPGVWSGLWGYDAIVEYKYKHDTLIQNKNCKIIKGTFMGQNYPDYSTLTHTFVPNYRTYYTYENNNVVYLFQDNVFDTVVNFNANIGDHWKLLRCPGESSNGLYTVTDTGHILINNVKLKSVTASYTVSITTDSIAQTHTLTNIFTERILGSVVNWSDLFGRDCFYIQPSGEAFGWPQPCGYKDSEISTVAANSQGTCRLTGIHENSDEFSGSIIYPNPNTGNFTLQLHKACHVLIYNTLGGLVFDNYFNSEGKYQINVETLPSGIYYLKAQTKSGSGFQKFVIE